MLPTIPGHGTQKKEKKKGFRSPSSACSNRSGIQDKKMPRSEEEKKKKKKLKSRLHPEGTVWPYHCSAVCNTLLSQKRTRDDSAAARDSVITSTSTASSEAWFSKMKPSLPPRYSKDTWNFYRLFRIRLSGKHKRVGYLLIS